MNKGQNLLNTNWVRTGKLPKSYQNCRLIATDQIRMCITYVWQKKLVVDVGKRKNKLQSIFYANASSSENKVSTDATQAILKDDR